jgi:hypothetical protein
MGLWNAVTGKVWHWNTTRLEVHQIVYPRLHAFPAQKVYTRNWIYAYYASFFSTFGHMMFGELPEIQDRDYLSRIKSINKNGFLSLLSAYFSDSAVRLFAGQAGDLHHLGACFLIEAGLLYGRDRLYISQRLELYDRCDNITSTGLLRNELALVLGFDATSEWQVGPWLAIRGAIENQATACMNEPDWSARITRELTRPPQLGGYPDSIITDRCIKKVELFDRRFATVSTVAIRELAGKQRLFGELSCADLGIGSI